MGSGVTSIRAVTRFVCGLIRRTRFSPGQAIHNELSTNKTDRQLAGSRISETIEFVSGSMRVSVVLSSVSTHTLSGLETIAKAAEPEPVAIVPTDFPVAVSRRDTPFPSQFTIQRLRNALTSPPHGFAISENGSSTLFERLSTRAI